MLSTTPREPVAAPLTTFNTETSDSNAPFLAFDERDEEHGLDFTQAGYNYMRAACWSFCSATAVYTTKRLMVIHGYHYPLTIAFRSFGTILIIYIVLLRIKSDANYIQSSKRSARGLRQPDGDDFLLNSYWGPMIPASLAAAASFPMLLEGILHMPSLAVLVMLFPVIYTIESLVLFVCCSKSRSQTYIPLEAVVSTAASSIVLYNEYRLMVPGLVFGVGGMLLIGAARGLFIVGSERAGTDIAVQARLKAYHGFVIMTLTFGLLFSGITGYYIESIRSASFLGISTVVLMIINLVSIVAAAFSGTSLLAYSPISFEDTALQFSYIPVHGADFLAPFAASLLLLLAIISSDPASFISLFQIAAYLVASICLLGAEQAQHLVLSFVDGIQQWINKSLGKERREPSKPSGVLTACTLFALLILFSSIISSFAYSAITSLAPSLPTSFDTAFVPPTRFEIVVSMYKEDPVSVRSMLESLRRTTLLATLQPRVIIYTKDPKQDLYQLKEATGADQVERLDNLGREGGTYLSHIVNKWDELAEQTMFIQAHAHNMRELIPRINSYLVKETGMLSLGFTGVTCTCNNCSDRWGWEDKWGVIPALYEKIYSHACEAEEQILLSYKGQFVASARRIRGISRKVFGGLLTTITSKEGWSHDTSSQDIAGVGADEDSPSNPYFGFAMERVWGLVMQCGTNAAVAARCPSLLSGMGKGGKVEDCQCLDVPVK
ncbi:hypothetical protein IFR04_014353 [Cadophora malorum]|uniref:Uncharacterized protein n=1 Tax=Cadophora malorum TaxID=108018 RepID=A0A8H7W2A2_9HELO|nr:hypothetical protein IFR04_014353 [Cadophora malorum]